MRPVFYGIGQQWRVVERVPGEMQVDFVIDIARHIIAKASLGRTLKRPLVFVSLFNQP